MIHDVGVVFPVIRYQSQRPNACFLRLTAHKQLFVECQNCELSYSSHSRHYVTQPPEHISTCNHVEHGKSSISFYYLSPTVNKVIVCCDKPRLGDIKHLIAMTELCMIGLIRFLPQYPIGNHWFIYKHEGIKTIRVKYVYLGWLNLDLPTTAHVTDVFRLSDDNNSFGFSQSLQASTAS